MSATTASPKSKATPSAEYRLATSDPLGLGKWIVIYMRRDGSEVRSKPLSYKAAVARLDFVALRSGIAGRMEPIQ